MADQIVRARNLLSSRATDDQDAHQVRPGRAVRAEWGPLCERRIRREDISVRWQSGRDPRRVLRRPLRHRSESGTRPLRSSFQFVQARADA